MAGELLSIVIPTYRGEATLPALLERLQTVMTERGQRYETIIVNDASPDETWKVVEQLATRYDNLVAVDLLHNHGQIVATMCGLSHARGDMVAMMDDDLQHPPEELPKLLDALEANRDLDGVMGWWPRDEGAFRNLGSWVWEQVDRAANGTPKGFRHSAFRVLRRPLVDALLAHGTRTPVIGAMIRKTSSRIGNVQVEHHARAAGSSGFNFRVGVDTVVRLLLHGSTLPLRLLARFGLLCSLFAATLGAVYFTRHLLGYHTPTGWASSFVAIVFFGGATLFGLGILGEYTHLVIQEVRQPPRWAIRGRLGPRDRDTT